MRWDSNPGLAGRLVLPVTAATLHGSQLKSVCALGLLGHLAERAGTPQGCDTFENPSGKPTVIFARLTEFYFIVTCLSNLGILKWSRVS